MFCYKLNCLAACGIGFYLSLHSLSAAPPQPPGSTNRLEARRDLLSSVTNGMSEAEVLKLLGQPDEIRVKGRTGYLDEQYRWVYGVGEKGEFPLVGSVIFGTNSRVFLMYCPSRSTGRKYAISMPLSEKGEATPSGMRCEIEDVFVHPGFKTHYFRVSLVNEGKGEFRISHDNQGIRFQLVLELYDRRKTLLLQEPIFGYHSIYSIDRSKWPVLVVDFGQRKSENVPIWWRDVNDGNLSPGTYYLRVGFPFDRATNPRSSKFYASNLFKFELPEGLQGKP